MANKLKENFFTRIAETFIRYYKRVSQLFGKQSDASGDPLITNSDLCFAQAARRKQLYMEKGLPEALLNTFSYEPLTADDMRFVGREKQLNSLQNSIEKWRAGHGSMVMITGLQGCGMTSFLQQVALKVGKSENFHYEQLEIKPHDITDSLNLMCKIVACEQPIGTVDELIKYINNLPPKVFAIDNGHFLVSRIMDSHNAIRTFGAIMVATQQRHLWILGCQEYAWRRLVYIYQSDRYFSERIELPLFSEAELGQCLALRLQVSGVTLSTRILDESQQVSAELLSQLNIIYRLSSGKLDFAFFYFLGALLFNHDKQYWEIQPAIELDFSLLKQLISEELFTLAEIAAHGQMTIDEHCAIFRTSYEESWLQLERLYHQCLLDKIENTSVPTYQLVPLYSEVIARHLTNANYLY